MVVIPDRHGGLFFVFVKHGPLPERFRKDWKNVYNFYGRFFVRTQTPIFT